MIQYSRGGRLLRHPAAILLLICILGFVALYPGIGVGSSLHRWAAVMGGQWILVLIAAWIYKLIFGRFPIDQFGVFPDNPGTCADRIYQYLVFMGLFGAAALILNLIAAG